MKLVNLTPHALTLRSETGDVVIEPTKPPARVMSRPGALERIEGIPVPVAAPDMLGAAEGLPPPVEGTFYIVAAPVGAAYPRADVLLLGTGPDDEPVRNEKGHVIAVTRLKRTI